MARTQPPRNASPGTVWFGGSIGWFSVSLTIAGEQLDPTEITRLLEAEPTFAYGDGQAFEKRDGTVGYRKGGRWTRARVSKQTDERDVGKVIGSLLLDFPSSVDSWRKLPAGASARLWLGLELTSANQGLSLEPEVCGWLSSRGISIELDVYRDDLENDPGIARALGRS